MRLILLLLLFLPQPSALPAQTHPEWKLILDTQHPDFGALLWTNVAVDLLKALQRQEAIADQLKTAIKVFANAVSAEDFSDHGGMLGSFQLKDSSLLFKPRFPFIEGKDYQIAIDGPALLRLADWTNPAPSLHTFHQSTIRIPHTQKLPPAQVSAIYPSSPQIPANLLKCYIQFAQTMSLESVYPHIRILDERGATIPSPFLELNPELWDPQRQRLTLWLDPGRIKRHLIPNQQMGAPLEANRQYTLVVDSTFRDAYGQTLAAPFRKSFFTSQRDSIKPAIFNWDIIPPVAASRGPLVLLFPEPLDIGVLASSIAVIDTAGQLVEGRISIGRREKSWLFTPVEDWQAGNYSLRISKDLEDLAGNNLERLFDTELVDGKGEVTKSESMGKDYVQLAVEILDAEDDLKDGDKSPDK